MFINRNSWQFQVNSSYWDDVGIFSSMLSETEKMRKNIPEPFLCSYKIYVARKNNTNKTEQRSSRWINANCIDRMTVFIFHSVTIKSTFCGIFHRHRYYNNAVPLFLCSHELTVITQLHLLLLVLSRRGVQVRSGEGNWASCKQVQKGFFPLTKALVCTERNKPQN